MNWTEQMLRSVGDVVEVTATPRPSLLIRLWCRVTGTPWPTKTVRYRCIAFYPASEHHPSMDAEGAD